MQMQITNPKSQLERVIVVCSDGQYRTLDRIRREIRARFNKSDTETAISARLREKSKLLKHGFVKQTRKIVNQKTKKPCFYYTLKRVNNESN